MEEEKQLPPQPRHWPRRLVACLAGFITFWTTGMFVGNNLGVSQSWKTYYDSRPLAERSEHSNHSYTYRVHFCGMELARDDNPDGRDIRDTIERLNDMCDWVKWIASVTTGVLVGGGVNVAWRLAVKPRSDEG